MSCICDTERARDEARCPIHGDEAQRIARLEGQGQLAIRCLREIAEHAITEDDPPSSDYLRRRCGLGAEEWREAGGQLLASLLYFAIEHNFAEWHAETMFERDRRRGEA